MVSIIEPGKFLFENSSAFLRSTANSIKTTPQLHLNSTFVVYHKGVPSRREHHRSGKQPRRKTTLGGTQVNPLVLRKGNEVAVR